MQTRSPTGDLLGRIFDRRYRVNELIGSGGMGSVYRATHLEMNREVALKVLEKGVADTDKQVQRFYQEARASSKLQHPNTIRVFDFGRAEDGRLYLAMEYLRGETLTELVRRVRRLDARRTCHILRQVCKSLAEAHQTGIIHRDLKPDNIFITDIFGEKDFVKVLDFGIAKSTEGEEQESLTQTGFICGTPRYLSPEQAMGKAIDARSDLYSLGVILFEMLAGKPPFIAATPIALVMKHIHEPPPRLADDGDPAGRWLATLAFALMQKSPVRRPDSAAAVSEALDAIAHGQDPAPILTRGARPEPPPAQRSASAQGTSVASAPRTMMIDSSEVPAPPSGDATMMLDRDARPAAHQPPDPDIDSQVILLSEPPPVDPGDEPTRMGVAAMPDPENEPTRLGVAAMPDEPPAGPSPALSAPPHDPDATRMGVAAMPEPRVRVPAGRRRPSVPSQEATRLGVSAMPDEPARPAIRAPQRPARRGVSVPPSNANQPPLEPHPMTRVMRSPLADPSDEVPIGQVRSGSRWTWAVVAAVLIVGSGVGVVLWRTMATDAAAEAPSASPVAEPAREGVPEPDEPDEQLAAAVEAPAQHEEPAMKSEPGAAPEPAAVEPEPVVVAAAEPRPIDRSEQVRAAEDEVERELERRALEPAPVAGGAASPGPKVAPQKKVNPRPRPKPPKRTRPPPKRRAPGGFEVF